MINPNDIIAIGVAYKCTYINTHSSFISFFMLPFYGGPNGIRTRVAGVTGRCPRPTRRWDQNCLWWKKGTSHLLRASGRPLLSCSCVSHSLLLEVITPPYRLKKLNSFEQHKSTPRLFSLKFSFHTFNKILHSI